MGSSASISAARGIQASMHAFERSATSPDLIDGMVGMGVAAIDVKANIAVFRTTDEMLGTLLDMKA